MRTHDVACNDAGALVGLGHAARDRALRVARTIADRADSDVVTDEHLGEAIALTDVASTLCATRGSVA